MTIFKHGTISQYIKYYGRTRDDEKGKTGGTEGQISKAMGSRDDGRNKAGRSEMKPHRRTKTRRPVRRDNVGRPRGHRTTDAIRRAGAKRSHTDEEKRDGWSKRNTRNRVLGEEYRHKHVRAGTVILFEGRGVPTRRTLGKDGTQGIEGGGGRGNDHSAHS